MPRPQQSLKPLTAVLGLAAVAWLRPATPAPPAPPPPPTSPAPPPGPRPAALPPPPAALLSRWRRDGLDGLGLDDLANGTSPALLARYPRLPTRAPCWAIRNASRCLPDFLLIGTMKAGTTALATYLQLHEDVYMSAKKEPNFFNPACSRRCPKGGHANNLRYYFSLFPALAPADDPAARRAALFEATPSYLFSSSRTAALLRAWLPDAKLLLLLRDPVERAYSQYNLGLSLLAEDETRPAASRKCNGSLLHRESFDSLVARALVLFDDCVTHLVRGSEPAYYACKRQPLRGNPCDDVVTASSLLNPGLYAYHIERFLSEFPQRQIYVIDSEQLGSRPKEVLAGVFDFLQLSQPSMESWPPSTFERVCPRYFGITSSKRYGAAPSHGLAVGAASPGAELRGTKPCQRYPPMAQRTRAALRRFYAPHNERLLRLLKQGTWPGSSMEVRW